MDFLIVVLLAIVIGFNGVLFFHVLKLEKIMATVDEALAAVVAATDQIAASLTAIAADIQVIKDSVNDPATAAKLDDIVNRVNAAAAAASALDAQNPEIPNPLP